MQAHRGFILSLCPFDDGKHLLQRHQCAVMYFAGSFAALQQLRIHEAAGIDHHISLFQKLRTAQGNQVRCTGTCSDKMNHFFLLLHQKSMLPCRNLQGSILHLVDNQLSDGIRKK